MHAIEAHPGNAAVLRANIALIQAFNVTLYDMAVTDMSGRVHLHLGGQAGHHYLTQTAEGGTLTVRATTLDAMVPAGDIDVLKLDIEGGELAALRGAQGLLARRGIKTIVTEVVDEHLARSGGSRLELLQLLTAWGFTGDTLNRSGLLGRSVPTSEMMFRLL